MKKQRQFSDCVSQWFFFPEARQLKQGLYCHCKETETTQKRGQKSFYRGASWRPRRHVLPRRHLAGLLSKVLLIGRVWSSCRAGAAVLLRLQIAVPGGASLHTARCHRLFFLINFYWSIVALQSCVSLYCIAKWNSYTYTHIPSFLDFLPI